MRRPMGHVFQPTGIIFDLVQDIIGMNLLTKNAPPLGSHAFQAKVTIFDLIKDISGTNLLSKFHEDRKINVASRVLTRKNAPPPGGTVFQPTGIIFELILDIIGMNLLTKFHKDQTINVASRVKNAPPLGSHVFQANVTIFELNQDIIATNLLTRFHEDQTINVASRDRTTDNTRRTTDKRQTARLLAAMFLNGTIFQIQQIIGTNRKLPSHEIYTLTAMFPDRLEPFSNSDNPGLQKNVQSEFHDDWAKHANT
ncbi:hypothetical protein DPMN_106176 [Dreissena polymorpha]|uniref:Uncharacterized protein n=1 Tax=Dreissena polymorpha TaxID=45954 RepID=A0A9D4K4I6_DREPO|nr:hypothetical protein DPMN_106176 [Dreissena polymorpha]